MLTIRSSRAALVVVLATVSLAGAQSLAHVAKKEQERRKGATPATPRTYTEEDLAGSPAGGSPASAGESTASNTAGRSGTRTAIPIRGEPSEAYWRARFTAARAKIDAAEAQLKGWEDRGTRARSNGATVSLHDCSAAIAAAQPGERIRASTCPQTGTLGGKLDEARAAVTAARQALVDLESEARRQGALPAWMR